MRRTDIYYIVNDNLIVILNYLNIKHLQYYYATSEREVTVDSSNTFTKFEVQSSNADVSPSQLSNLFKFLSSHNAYLIS